MSLLQSSSPRIAQHLRGTALTGVSDKQLGQWGGALHSRAQVEGALASLDGVIVLLELAGYVVDSVAFAVAKGNTTHKNADAVVLELPSLSLNRGVEGAWPSQPEGAPRGRVGLWVRPRRARLPNDLWLDGCAVDLREQMTLFADLGIRMEFSPTIDGWFTLPVDSARWADSLVRACERACDKVTDILGDCAGAAGPGQLTDPGCGLLALLDPASWQLGDPTIVGTMRPLDEAGGARELSGDVFAQFMADPARFLLEDTASAPRTVLERVDLLDDLRPSESRWSEMLDELGGVEGSPAGLGELRPEYGDVLSWTHLMLWMHELGVLDGLSAIARAQPMLTAPAVPYGGYVLRRGDSDAAKRWGGRIAGADDPRPAAGNFGYVRQLQSDLRKVGILVGPIPTGEFDVMTEMALREFEIAARFPRVARPRAGAVGVLPEDTLEAIPLPEQHRLTGPILGALEPAVAKALQSWVANDWRHPVVLYAVRRGEVRLVNLWHWDAIKDKGARVWAWDQSGQYEVDTSRELPYFVGKYTNDKDDTYHGGPGIVNADDLWSEVALTPARLVDPEIEQIPQASRKTDPRWSTYRVVAAVAKVEMINQFDALNAWDPGVISLGLYHWILGGGRGRGELCALFALLRERHPEAFEAVMGRFGVQPTARWGDEGMYDPKTRTHTASLSMRRADGLWSVITSSAKNDEKQWFRGWSWYYRLQMACRTSDALRRTMWELGRIRLRDLLSAPWPGRGLSLGELFTSERLVAMLLRWHVNLPATLVNADGVRGRLFKRGLPAGDPADWGSAELAILEQNILASVTFNKNLKKTVGDVYGNRDLEQGPHSFHMDWSGL